MNIDKINEVSKLTKLYNSNKVNSKPNVMPAKTDKIEISSAARALNGLGNSGLDIDRNKKVESIRNQIQNGTYNCDAKLIAQSIMKAIKESTT
ncbi:flagellar biosynthesis anti-sigma factor FlgM [Inconstantimicrobium mannanitabidum]|uniref:Uncharacterized protein n=1 Tax=Inconstantimicrobium mannanitabidum TaxID=1604901 RepID=A0ACB5R8I8_9CLOT|nr:flagellar biosynthesis anti-sigma factor FlgM [Clostridium sp. TW13]GKX65457.1 hypothetical protein rsdtw13_07150 [Clostridium sp. TW13]